MGKMERMRTVIREREEMLAFLLLGQQRRSHVIDEHRVPFRSSVRSIRAWHTRQNPQQRNCNEQKSGPATTDDNNPTLPHHRRQTPSK